MIQRTSSLSFQSGLTQRERENYEYLRLHSTSSTAVKQARQSLDTDYGRENTRQDYNVPERALLDDRNRGNLAYILQDSTVPAQVRNAKNRLNADRTARGYDPLPPCPEIINKTHLLDSRRREDLKCVLTMDSCTPKQKQTAAQALENDRIARGLESIPQEPVQTGGDGVNNFITGVFTDPNKLAGAVFVKMIID